MPLHERIGEIFLANECDEVQTAFSDSLERFLVPDRGTCREGLRVVLLVESPHTYEVCHGYPLAGPEARSAGRRVRNKLMECRQELQLPEQPIGRLVHQGHDAIQVLGIMNVSQLPFQSAAYNCIPWEGGDCRCRPEWSNYVRRINTIKNDPDKFAVNRRSPECKDLDEAIAENLRGRLQCLHGNNPDVLLVCCGDVAQEFCSKAIGREPVIFVGNIRNLPHPNNRGRGGERWEDLDCQNPCLRQILERLRPPQAEA